MRAKSINNIKIDVKGCQIKYPIIITTNEQKQSTLILILILILTHTHVHFWIPFQCFDNG